MNQSGFETTELPEFVDLAVIGCGLGLLQSEISFVQEKQARFWDATRWNMTPRPFLDDSALAYAMAWKAWTAGEKDPGWIGSFRGELVRPSRKSLKYLNKTSDCFIQPASGKPSADHSQNDWLQIANGKSASSQIIAMRNLIIEEQLASGQERMLTDNLRSSNQDVVLHALAAVESANASGDEVVEELRILTEDRHAETRAKAMITLARCSELDERSVETAASMINDGARYVVFAGLVGLAASKSIPDSALGIVERGYVRALQTCDYEFVGLFTAAFMRWMDDPEVQIRRLLEHEEPGYLTIALDSLNEMREQADGAKSGS
ncbi:MAG: hypothetical protein AAF456_07045 [Planctomycetota bacterium]